MISGRLHTSRLLPRLPLALLALAFLLAGAAPWALAVQGSAEDYERAAGLRGRFEGLLLRHDAEPRWLDGQRLWYTVTVAPDEREVVVVDAALPAAERRLVLAAEDALAGAAAVGDAGTAASSSPARHPGQDGDEDAGGGCRTRTLDIRIADAVRFHARG